MTQDIVEVLLALLALTFITEQIVFFALLWLIGRVVPLSLFEVIWRENLALAAAMVSDVNTSGESSDGERVAQRQRGFEAD